jgi:hypothetical protein
LAGSLNTHQTNPPADDYFQNFCAQIIDKHYFIRSAAIANNVGHLMAAAYRKNLVPLMTFEDSARAAAQAAIRAATRNKFKSKIGELQFSISRYEKLVRATIPIKNDEKLRFLLLLTFDIEVEADTIILRKILPLLSENKEYFIQ